LCSFSQISSVSVPCSMYCASAISNAFSSCSVQMSPAPFAAASGSSGAGVGAAPIPFMAGMIPPLFISGGGMPTPSGGGGAIDDGGGAIVGKLPFMAAADGITCSPVAPFVVGIGPSGGGAGITGRGGGRPAEVTGSMAPDVGASVGVAPAVVEGRTGCGKYAPLAAGAAMGIDAKGMVVVGSMDAGGMDTMGMEEIGIGMDVEMSMGTDVIGTAVFTGAAIDAGGAIAPVPTGAGAGAGAIAAAVVGKADAPELRGAHGAPPLAGRGCATSTVAAVTMLYFAVEFSCCSFELRVDHEHRQVPS